MAKLSADQITSLCENYRKAAYVQPGRAEMGQKSESFRLLEHGLEFHNLDFDELIASILGLTSTLSDPGLSIISSDHTALWSWCGEFLFGVRSTFFEGEKPNLKPLFKNAILVSIAHSKAYDPREIDLSLILSYIVFPLLEAILKRAACEYMAPDGSVIKPFHKPDGKNLYTNKNTCSNLYAMLTLHYTHIASPELKKDLDTYKAHIELLDKEKSPFEMIFFWRNDTLHGNLHYPTIAGTLLNLCLLIIIHELKDQYNERRDTLVQRIEWFFCKSPDAFLYYPQQ
ncbi:hypothetical protein [Pseudomonas mucidolens]|uniref:Uncharacterized protein n=1 Tax=Pseudomonas mucidolens TaxID=46679 RepID=A0A1H2M4R5_9PSED|nr:hypothetical protein [Pseudomonas mucidolens]SDU88102.1 hypothetical protein SAMN05216202_1009 [Pseudomonas mucidolens]SQH34558.1 Uncharacterised protein [Pseudomonas mucidolens]